MTHPPANPASEVARIADSLTPDQQATLLRDTADPKWEPPMWFKVRCPGVATYHPAGMFTGSHLRWTPLGLAVRAHLLTQAAGDTM